MNPTANLLIMTAEILKKSLMKNNTNMYQFDLTNVSCVVLDEVHFINNKDRGKVWEEIIITLNININLRMLSATLDGIDNFSKWLKNIRKKNVLLHQHLKDQFRYINQYGLIMDYIIFLNENEWSSGNWNRIINKLKKDDIKDTNLYDCIKYLYDNNLTPVNVFILSKKKIEAIVANVQYYFITPEESSLITKTWNKYLANYIHIYENTPEWNKIYKLIMKGIGYHHAGMIPILKEIMEI